MQKSGELSAHGATERPRAQSGPSVLFAPLSLSTPRTTSSTNKRAMKVTIKEWNAVAAWRWDMPDDDVCGICRNPYDSTCSKCKYPGDDCPLRTSARRASLASE